MRPFLKITAAAALALALAACSGSDEDETTDTPDETPVEQVDETPAAEETPSDEAPAEEAPAEETSAEETAPVEEPVGEEPAGEGEAAPGEEAAAEQPAVGEIAAEEPVATVDLENTLYMELSCGRVVIEMLPDVAPLHVAQIKTLVRQGFYDGIVFHRVIDGFMAQTGDPTGTGRGGSDLPDIPAEFSSIPFERGTVGMARTPDPNSANSQFFIMFSRTPSLDTQYTVWGEVTDGMNCVDQIARGEPPVNPDQILSLQVAADVQ